MLALLSGCGDETTPAAPAEPPALAYVGSDACATCHETNYQRFVESGHPYKLTEVVGDQGPTYPWDSEHSSGAIVAQDGPPDGLPWSDFAYVIGGYGWKARWVKKNGLVHTGAAVQLNLHANGPEWVAYHDGEEVKYQYSCFKCHTTGASQEGAWASETNGTFAFGGVQCEECHGRGSQHAFSPTLFEMTIDSDKNSCGKCHTRDPGNRVLVKGGFIRHHEQFDEMVNSVHGGLDCVSCHDPHSSTVYDDVALGNGVRSQCTDCHNEDGVGGKDYINNNSHVVSVDCVSCHMPKAAKSARAENAYMGDIASHTWKLNPAAVDKSTMWTSDGKFLAQDQFGHGVVTLDFACYRCHKDASGVGGSASMKSLAELSTRATGIHDEVVPFVTLNR